MKTNLLSIDELTRIARSSIDMNMRTMALREIAHRDNHVYYRDPGVYKKKQLKITDYALSDSIS